MKSIEDHFMEGCYKDLADLAIRIRGEFLLFLVFLLSYCSLMLFYNSSFFQILIQIILEESKLFVVNFVFLMYQFKLF